MKFLSQTKMWSAAGALAFGALLTGCGGNSSRDSTNSTETTSANSATTDTTATDSGASSDVKLTGAGATFPYPLYSKWFDTYKTKTGVEINYASVGSGAGIKQLKSQTVDFGASDAALSDKDAAEMPSEVLHIPTVAGAVVVVYNVAGAPKNLKMSGDVLADIFLGKITNWNDPKIGALNAGVKLPALPITVAHRSDGSGTTNIFTTYLKSASPNWSVIGAGKSVAWPVGVGGKGNDGVSSAVKTSKGGIGYVELAYATQNDLSYASIRNSAGQFIAPSVDATTSAAQDGIAGLQKDIRTPIANGKGAKSYPIAGFTYILVYKKQRDAAKGKALKDFLKWSMKDGQAMGKALQYAPLPQEVIALNDKAIDSIQ